MYQIFKNWITMKYHLYLYMFKKDLIRQYIYVNRVKVLLMSSNCKMTGGKLILKSKVCITFWST